MTKTKTTETRNRLAKLVKRSLYCEHDTCHVHDVRVTGKDYYAIGGLPKVLKCPACGRSLKNGTVKAARIPK